MLILPQVIYALDKGYVPVIDGKNYRTQYNAAPDDNWWESFFNQPTQIPLEEVYTAEHIMLSGGSCSDYNELTRAVAYTAVPDAQMISAIYAVCQEHCFVKKEIMDEVHAEYERLLRGNGDVLGVFLRGTDYTALQPKGHRRQPDVSVVIADMGAYIGRHGIRRIFVVTEDDGVFRAIQNAYGDMIIPYDDFRFSGYDGKDFLAHYVGDKSAAQVGRIYLKKIMLLSLCDYLIASITNGSRFALFMNNNQYKDKMIYDLGMY